jgi:N-methylhydantoinase B
MDVASTAFAKMLLASERFRSEAQANWSPGIHGGMLIAPNPGAPPSVAAITDPFGGGGGARTFTDGIDSGGIPHSMASRVSNVEVIESRAPLLEIYRRELRDSGGPGRFRGGVSIESAGIQHKVSQPSTFQTLASGVSVPAGRGLSGGSPGVAASSKILRGSNIAELFARGRVPTSANELTAERVEVQEAKQFTLLEDGDVVVGVESGGAGYGDPLRRDAQAVLRDVQDGLVSIEIARAVYGVVVVDDVVDEPSTAAERDSVRERRRSEGVLPDDARPGREVKAEGEPLHRVNDTVEAVSVAGEDALRCAICHHRFCAYVEDYKRSSVMRELALAATVPGNSACRADYVLREYSCPGCGTAVAMDVQQRDELLQDESRFASVRAARD